MQPQKRRFMKKNASILFFLFTFNSLQYIQLHVAQVAQLVEQWIEAPRVGGSIPSLSTIYS